MTASDAAAALPRGVRALWGIDEPGRRGPKPALSVPAIAAAAVELADEEGLDAVSMAAVAKRLGFTTMSLYRYLESRDELHALMIEWSAGPVGDLGTGGWRDRLAAWARADAGRLAGHPWALSVRTDGPPLGPNMMAWTDAGMQVLLDAGLAPAQAASSLLAVDGFARQHVSLGVQFADTEATRLWSSRMRSVLDPDRFPALTTVLEAGVFDDEPKSADFPDDEFEFGLGLLLDGIERLVAAARPNRARQPRR